jgi:hypothetical protein
MFCPKCATQNVDGASFCRACGANVSLIPQALLGQLPAASNSRGDFYSSRKWRGEPSIDNAVRAFMTAIGFVAMALIIFKFGPGGATWWYWFLVPAAMTFARGLSEVTRCRLRKSQPPNITSNLAQPHLNSLRQDISAPKTGELMTPVASVTEGTTRHLGTEARTHQVDSFETQRPS